MVRSFVSMTQHSVSPDIGLEVSFFLHAMITGGLLLLLYDGVRIFRRIHRHSGFAVNIEDFLYWIVSSIIIFVVLVKENNGIIRWFFVIGMFVGMILYHLTISRYFVDGVTFLLKKILHVVSVVLKVLLTPVVKLVKFLAKYAGRLWKYIQEILKKVKKYIESYIKKRYNNVKCPHRRGKKSDRSNSSEQDTRKKKTKRE